MIKQINIYGVEFTYFEGDISKTHKDVDSILEFIKENGICFPYKRIVDNIDVKKIVKELLNRETKWNDEKYEIKDYNFANTNILSVTKLSNKFFRPEYDKGVYLSYQNTDYNLDKLTDYYIEFSRLNSFRPNFNNNSWSPSSAWYDYDDETNYKRNAIQALLDNNTPVTMLNIREMLFKDKTIKEVAHEKITFLSSFFDFIKSILGDLRIFDACAGWGDRYIASYISNASEYLGIEPNELSFDAFDEIHKVFFKNDEKFVILNQSMPKINIENKTFNLCFLSPPSYDTENYGDSEGQSTELYPEKIDWTFNFLYKTIDKCWELLEYGGFLVVQSILFYEIFLYIKFKVNDAQFLGPVSVKTDSGRLKPMWIWYKSNTESPNDIKINPIVTYNPFVYDRLFNNMTAVLTTKKNIHYPNAKLWNTDSNLDFRLYDKVMIFMTYDYINDPDRFMDVLEKAGNKLINPLSTIKWNIMKSNYLADLSDEGVNVIPFEIMSVDDLNRIFKLYNDYNYIVIKPIIGASSTRVKSFMKPKNMYYLNKLKEDILELGYDKSEYFMVSPYFSDIKRYGEISLIYYHDGFSHSVIKKFKNSNDNILNFKNRNIINNYRINKHLIELGYSILEKSGQKYCYARIDIITHNNQYYLLELEMIDCNLFYKSESEQFNVMIEKSRSFN